VLKCTKTATPSTGQRVNDGQTWFLEKQQQLTERVGDPVLLAIKMPFDAWFEVVINTFTGRTGMATDQEVETAVEQTVEMLLEMDEVIAEAEHSDYCLCLASDRSHPR
jgi:hypothetical protein